MKKNGLEDDWERRTIQVVFGLLFRVIFVVYYLKLQKLPFV